MADRPILFSAPMVRALLDDRKTQTRRILKFQPAPGVSIIRKTIRPLDADPYHSFERRSIYGNYAGELDIKIRRGDRLWVKETHLPDPPSDDLAWNDNVCTYVEWSGCGSKVSDVPISLCSTDHCIYAADPKWTGYEMRWRPSIHMPRWASRLTLIITDVRVERLQDISEEDAIEEGIEHKVICGVGKTWKHYANADAPVGWNDPRQSYGSLWDSINGLGAWDANPWVTAYTFRVIQSNIDKVAA